MAQKIKSNWVYYYKGFLPQKEGPKIIISVSNNVYKNL